MRVQVVVASKTGHTARMAEALADGARQVAAEVSVLRAEEAGAEVTLAADALVLGSGVHMGGIAAAMSDFLARTAPLWLQGRLVGKLGAAFATAGSGGRGGAELALLVMLAALAEHGCLLVPMPARLEGFAAAGCHWGPVAVTKPEGRARVPTERDLAAAHAHGRHVAECTSRWLAGAGGF